MNNTFYIVQYNDRYGNGNKILETLVRDEKSFQDWLKFHNAQRDIDGNELEQEDEFDLIPISLFES